jgi:hypothetical protein
MPKQANTILPFRTIQQQHSGYDSDDDKPLSDLVPGYDPDDYKPLSDLVPGYDPDDYKPLSELVSKEA